MNPQTTATYKAIGKLDDRSGLSQEMRDLCANLTIYRVVKQNDTADQKSDSGDADPAKVPAGEGRDGKGATYVHAQSMPMKSEASEKLESDIGIEKKTLFSSEQKLYNNITFVQWP